MMTMAIPQHIIKSLRRMEKTPSQNDITKSQLRFTVPDEERADGNNKTSLNRTKDLSDEIFRTSINASSIGRMSRNNDIAKKFEEQGHSLKEIQQADEEQEQKEAESRQIKKRKRIDFSAINSNIQRSMLVSEEDQKYLRVVSMIDAQGRDHMQMDGCTFCGQDMASNRCMIELENESTMNIYRSSEKGEFTKLFFSLNFDTVSAQIERAEEGEFRQIAIKAQDCKLILEHESRTVVHRWYDDLTKMQQQSKGKQHPLFAITQQPNFYTTRYQTESFFAKNCQTGDIILFEDSHFFAKAQRFITDSDFDHVAMVVRDTTHGILLFESNSTSGVLLTPWKFVVKFEWYKSIPRIVWRRLHDIKRSAEFNLIVEKFVMQNISKKYHISLDKLMMNTSMLRAQDPQGQQKEEHGFFCSQLVASMYKDLRLLTRDTKSQNYKPGCNFYPKDFTERTGRKLDTGRLSPEYQIFFDEKELAKHYNIK